MLQVCERVFVLARARWFIRVCLLACCVSFIRRCMFPIGSDVRAQLWNDGVHPAGAHAVIWRGFSNQRNHVYE